MPVSVVRLKIGACVIVRVSRYESQAKFKGHHRATLMPLECFPNFTRASKQRSSIDAENGDLSMPENLVMTSTDAHTDSGGAGNKFLVG